MFQPKLSFILNFRYRNFHSLSLSVISFLKLRAQIPIESIFESYTTFLTLSIAKNDSSSVAHAIILYRRFSEFTDNQL